MDAAFTAAISRIRGSSSNSMIRRGQKTAGRDDRRLTLRRPRCHVLTPSIASAFDAPLALRRHVGICERGKKLRLNDNRSK